MKLYPFQKHVAELLLGGSNVILQAPTGAGKTHAAMLPFLNVLEHNRDFPRKCIYSVPMRVLANQFVDQYTPLVKRAGRDEQIRVAVQTGDSPRDRKLESDLIFATIDQTLSSFLLSPYSLSHSQANLNAAAVMASYLVFDEFHLYDPASTLPTTLHMLMMLKGITPFILMTATFSADMLEALANLLDAEVVPKTESDKRDLQALESQQKERRYHVCADPSQPLSAYHVLNMHEGRSLVICNTVDRARQIHKELSNATRHTDTRVILLHSRFLRSDRDAIEDEIRQLFGKESPKTGSLIVVSTQAIEVGVDITCTRLHTELAPANAILQRAGRCARYKGDSGDVFIYQYVQGSTPDEKIDLLEDFMPYKSQQAQFAATLAQFQARDGTVLGFSHEQEIISAVHGPRDREIIDELTVAHYDHRRRMFSVMRGDNRAEASDLIRDIWQQQVTIHANPDELLEAPFDAPSFGLHPGTLQGYVKTWLEKYQQDESIPWAVKWLKEDNDPDTEQANRRTYRWEPVHQSAKEVLGAPLVVVHPLLASYHPQLGFLPDEGGDWQVPIPTRAEKNQGDRHRYRLETYERHIQLVYEAAFDSREGVWNELDWLARRLEQRFGWSDGSIRRAAELAVLLHDVGKLNTKWQKWVRDYQQRIGSPAEAGHAYAHTDLYDEEHRTIEKQMPRRPWHAVEGAIAAVPILLQEFGEQHPLVLAIFGAIARHHSADSDSNQAFRLVNKAADHVFATFNEDRNGELVGISEDIPQNAGARDYLPEPMSRPETFSVYLLLVRLLRRADQIGTQKGSLESI